MQKGLWADHPLLGRCSWEARQGPTLLCMVPFPLVCSLAVGGLAHLGGQRRVKGKCLGIHQPGLHMVALPNDSCTHSLSRSLSRAQSSPHAAGTARH